MPVRTTPINSNRIRERSQRIKRGLIIDDDGDFSDILHGRIQPLDNDSLSTPALSMSSSVSIEADSVETNQDTKSQGDEESDLDADALLAYATIRLQQQHLKDEVRALKEMLNQKDEHIMHLTSQLKRATASKCDLVVHVTELERQKQLAEQYGSVDTQEQRRKYLKVMEERAEIELHFMNELNTLMDRMKDLDRRHRNQIVEKDFVIAQLNDELLRVMKKI